MSAATVVMTVEGALLAIALLFVVALLRSHAEILRRLTAIEAAGPDGVPAARPAAGPPADAADNVEARDIVGETLAGDAVKLALGPGSPPTLLAFLSSGCAACGPLWEGLSDHAQLPAGARLVVVTKGPDRESITRLRRLAPEGREVVMSAAAWEDFSVSATPHFVLVDGVAGQIAGRGSATSWEQIGSLVADAEADSSLQRVRSSPERAARAEQALAAAGIAAGHPSLYPSRTAAGSGQRPQAAGEGDGPG